MRRALSLPHFFHHFELPPRHGDVRRLQERRYRFATGLGVNGAFLTESALLSRSASRSSEVAIPRRLYRLSTAIRAMSPEAGSKMQYPACVPSARALSPAKSPAARLMASGLFCQEGMKSQNCGSGGEPSHIDGRYRTGNVRDFRAEVHVRALLYGIIEFTRRFEPELPVDRYRLCVVLQDFQQVLPDSGLPQVGNGVFEDLCGEPLPAIGFEGSRAGVVGRRQTVRNSPSRSG